eukprot:SAG31_NODE_6441_length_2017_cov_1.540146_3_plen_72_part_00
MALFNKGDSAEILSAPLRSILGSAVAGPVSCRDVVARRDLPSLLPGHEDLKARVPSHGAELLVLEYKTTEE